MILLKRIHQIIFFAGCLLSCSVMANVETQDQYYYDSWSPMYKGAQLAYCDIAGAHCGHDIAKAYCQLLGYQEARDVKKAFNVGLTHYLLSKLACRGWRCDGFEVIRCVGHLGKQIENYHYRRRHFALPRKEHYRIDWCFNGKSACGQRAADSFCRQQGYRNATQFEKQTHIGATRAISNGRLCFGLSCVGFSYINCYR